MKYLKKFFLNDSDIDELENKISSEALNEFVVYENRITEILEFLLNKGIKDIKRIILERESIFFNTKKSIEKAFESRKDINIVAEINEDSSAFELIGL